MGAYGSGNFGPRTGRRTTSHVGRVTVAALLGVPPDATPDPELSRLRAHGGELSLSLERGGVVAGTRVRIRISTTRQPTGGVRCWIHCPRCQRRCSVLYVPETVIACRLCHRLYYATQRLVDHERWELRAHKLLARVGGKPGDEIFRRPKGMHERTFDRLLEQAFAFRDAAFAASYRSLQRRIPGLAPMTSLR